MLSTKWVFVGLTNYGWIGSACGNSKWRCVVGGSSDRNHDKRRDSPFLLALTVPAPITNFRRSITIIWRLARAARGRVQEEIQKLAGSS